MIHHFHVEFRIQNYHWNWGNRLAVIGIMKSMIHGDECQGNCFTERIAYTAAQLLSLPQQWHS